jgi:hypothetical protein
MATHFIDRTRKLVVIFPQRYVAGKKYPTFNFHHGIGENALSDTNNTLDEFSEFHRFLDKWADGLGGEEMIFILPQDQDSNVATTQHVAEAWKWADQYTDGRKGIGGLSMGGGETMQQFMSGLYTKYPDATFILPICFPSWESLDEKPLALDKRPFWAFMGVKDGSVTIGSFVNTIGDIIAAGRKPDSNFYVTIYPNRDHFIWSTVLGSVVPVSPNTGALDANGKTIYGLSKYAGIADWAMVNNPAITPIAYFLMQWPNNYKPLPRLGEVVVVPEPPAPTPTPTPAPSGKRIIRVNTTGKPVSVSIQEIDANGVKSSRPAFQANEVDTVQVNGKTRYTIKKNGVLVMPVFEI